MATQSVRQEFNRFVKGLITEATLLNFPSDAASVLNNFDLDAKGVVERRYGIDHETLNTWRTLGTLTLTSDVIQSYRWDGVAGQADKTIIVVQSREKLYFFTNVTSDFSINYDSSMVIDLSSASYKVATATTTQVRQNPCSFSSGRGKLYINHKYTETLEVSYVIGAPDTITVNVQPVKIRDFAGEDDGFNNDEKPTSATINNEHWYNLANQGWLDRITDLKVINTSRGSYPSNAEQWQYGKYVNVSSGAETWSYAHFEKQAFGNTLAPRGHYIIDAFNKNVTGVPTGKNGSFTESGSSNGTVTSLTSAGHGLTTGTSVTLTSTLSETYDNGGGCGASYPYNISGTYTITVTGSNTFTIPDVKAGFVAWCDSPAGTWVTSTTATIDNPLDTRPQSNAFYAGRCWQSGVEEDGFTGSVYFSQILQKDNQFGLCYQEADPTAEHSNELVATDGGVVNIPDMDVCKKMVPFGPGLLLLATNGVWFISGGESPFFTPLSYSVDRVSSIGIISAKSVIDAEGTPHFWSKEGIHRIIKDEVSGSPKVESLTVQTIQTYYDDITDVQKATCRGTYNDKLKKIVWIYQNNTSNVRELSLVFDLRTNGFFPWTFNKTAYYIIDVMTMPDYRTYVQQKIKFLVYKASDGTLGGSDMSNIDHYDWTTNDAAGELQTADIIVSSPALEQQTKQVTFYFERTEDVYISDGGSGVILDNQSSCTMQPVWDWSDHTNAGKFGTAREIYRFRRVFVGSNAGDPFNNGYPMIISKNKVRGSGRAVRFKLTTTAGYKMKLLGWTNTLDVRDTE